MSPEKIREILELFLRIFSDEWTKAYEALCDMGLSDRQTVGSVSEQIAMLDDNKKGLDGKPLDEYEEYIIDTLKDARSFFHVYWELFKFECAQKRLILTKEEALEFLAGMIPCEEVWKEIVIKDRDFELFERIQRHKKEDQSIEAARDRQQEAEVANLERKQTVVRALEKNLLRSGDKTLHIDRLKLPFAEELELAIADLEAEGVYSSPKEMSQLLSTMYPHIPRSLHLLLNPYVPRFKAMRENPRPKMKEKVYKPVIKVQQISLSQVEIDHVSNTLKFNELKFEFTPKGIVDILTALRKTSELNPDEFGAEIKNLLRKIREYCHMHKINGFEEMACKLQKKYQEMWFKSDKCSDEALKIGMIFVALGMIHVDMAESHIDPQKRPNKRFKGK